MNFLAHAYLSFGDPKVLVGNIIGDFVRGPLEDKFERDIVIGIILHRDIDRFTDSHPVVKEAQGLLKPEYGRYSTVITDMYFDYFLGRYWKNYNPKSLEEFTEEVYGIVGNHLHILPDNFLPTFEYMKNYNWLAGYAKLDGIKKALVNLSKRTKFESKMETAHSFLDQHHEYFRLRFGDFFEDLISYSKQRLIELKAEK